MDPDPGHEHFLKITDFFKKRRIIKFFFYTIILYFENKTYFFSSRLKFCPLDPDPRSHKIFLLIRIQEAKMLQIPWRTGKK